MRYFIVLNEEAGRPDRAPDGGTPEELQKSFGRAGVDAEIHVVKPSGIADAVRSGLSSRADAVIVGGGDGTVRSAAAVLVGTGMPLGVLPMGTLNHFAKDLRIPLDLQKAVPALAGGMARGVDVGEVNGEIFINNCSIGAYAEAVRRRDALRDRHDIGKWRAMIRACFEEFRRLRRLRMRIAIGKSRPARPVRTPMVVVGNNRYSGRLLSQNLRARLNEGRLWLYTVRAPRHFAVLRMMLQSCLRRLDEVEALEAEPAQEIVVESDGSRLPIAVDGEFIEILPPLHFSIRPAALRVLVPADVSASKDSPPVSNSGPVVAAGFHGDSAS